MNFSNFIFLFAFSLPTNIIKVTGGKYEKIIEIDSIFSPHLALGSAFLSRSSFATLTCPQCAATWRAVR